MVGFLIREVIFVRIRFANLLYPKNRFDTESCGYNTKVAVVGR